MSKSKISIEPLENYKVKVVFSLQELTKNELIDLGDSYLLEINHSYESYNDLYFSILFNKRLMQRPTFKEGNPSIKLVQNLKMITIEIVFIIEEDEISNNLGDYVIEKEFSGDSTFKLTYKVLSSTYSEKILEARSDHFNEKPYYFKNEPDLDYWLQTVLKENHSKGIKIAKEYSKKNCGNCYYCAEEYICGIHNVRVNKQNICSKHYNIKVFYGGAVSPK